MHGELRRVHLVADRARGSVGALGTQHLLDQPARSVQIGIVLFDQIGPCGGHAVQRADAAHSVRQ